MRILMLTTSSSLLDGINRHILTISQALNRCPNVEIAVCSVCPGGELHAELRKSGVRTYSLESPHGHALGIFHRFNRVMRDFRPDVVHAHVLALFEQIELSLLYRGKKVVRTFHGLGGLPPLRKRLLDRLFRIQYAADCFISQGVRDYYRKLGVVGGQRTGVIYNPMSWTTVGQAQAGILQNLIGVPSGTPVIGSACRIAEVKNPLALMDVMCRVLRAVEDAHAVLIGDGPAEIKGRLVDFLQAQDVSARVHLLGYRSDAAALVGDLSCFVMTSRSEGMPTALLEAIAARTPVAFFRGEGGLVDLAKLNRLRGPFAVTAEMDDCSGLAAGIVDIIRNPQVAQSLVECAYEVGRSTFDVDVIAGQLLELYGKVVS